MSEVISSPYLWFSLIFVFLTIEIFLPSFFFGAFAVAALVTGILSLFVNQFAILLGCFCAFSVIVFLTLRNWYFSLIKRKEGDAKFGINALIGKFGNVIQKIIPDEVGYIRLDGESWQAKAKEIIEVGVSVKVLRNEGNILWVEKA
jgi:membrane protein implicated in regulation of membrane protease activity